LANPATPECTVPHLISLSWSEARQACDDAGLWATSPTPTDRPYLPSAGPAAS